MTIEFVSFGRTDWAAHQPDEAQRRAVTGPWRFDIDLGGSCEAEHNEHDDA